MRIISVTPAPPIASVTIPPSLFSLSRNRFIWCTEPSADAAKKKRSVTSHARWDMGCGNWNVVRRDLEEMSQSCDTGVLEVRCKREGK